MHMRVFKKFNCFNMSTLISAQERGRGNKFFKRKIFAVNRHIQSTMSWLLLRVGHESVDANLILDMLMCYSNEATSQQGHRNMAVI